jgi:hypothetical protein
MSNRLSRGRVNSGWGRSYGDAPYEGYVPPLQYTSPLQYWEEFFIENDHLGDDRRSQTRGSQPKGMYDVHGFQKPPKTRSKL